MLNAGTRKRLKKVQGGSANVLHWGGNCGFEIRIYILKRKGHLKEAKKLFYQYVFDKLSVELLYADVWEGNTNSIKSLESYGYKLIETKREFFSKTGKYTLKYIYSLSKEYYHRNLKNQST